MLELALKLLAWIIPPLTADPVAQYMHRIRLTIFSCSAFAGVIVLTSASFGWTPWFAGFARQGDLKFITRHVLAAELMSERYHGCTTQNEDARRLYADKVNQLLEEYRLTTGLDFNLPACTDL